MGSNRGAFARYFDKNLLGLYLVKKIYLDASETELTGLTQLCIEAAVGERICEERPGVRRMRKKLWKISWSRNMKPCLPTISY